MTKTAIPNLLRAAPLAILVLAGVSAPRASAESYGIGARIGLAMDASSGVDVTKLEDKNFELQLHAEVEPGVLLRLRLNRMNVEALAPKHNGDPRDPSGRFEKIGMDIEYQFAMNYYVSGVFIGAGYYRFRSDEDRLPLWDDGHKHFGYYGGVNGWFEVSPGWAVVPEISVDHVNNEKPRTFAGASLGIVYRF